MKYQNFIEKEWNDTTAYKVKQTKRSQTIKKMLQGSNQSSKRNMVSNEGSDITQRFFDRLKILLFLSPKDSIK